MNEPSLPPFEFVDFDKMPGVSCPCGTAKRGLASAEDFPGTVHVTQITKDARKHFHRSHTEVYYFLECDKNSKMELNGEVFPVKQGDCVYIRSGTFHRAIGEMKVLIISMPKFDPEDEHFETEKPEI